ncbi:putative RNA methylase [Thermofilum pendens Hrk 5]|uniref:RNA methylase n=1 Tax=Thermofilum pendens (strain DSM 2475 / Hrk 5) TaxID=368408 RepID=A1RY22_THEPD|nr:putative RNA methylase [Thermofilum pendens Hrk 5]
MFLEKFNVSYPNEPRVFAVYTTWCVSRCNFYETLEALESTGEARVLGSLGDRLVFLAARSLEGIVERLYSVACVEELYFVLGEARLGERPLLEGDMLSRVSHLLLHATTFNVKILDCEKMLGVEEKAKLREDFSKILKELREGLRASRTGPDLEFVVIVLSRDRALLSLTVKRYRKDRFAFRSPERRAYSQPSALTPWLSLTILNLALATQPAGGEGGFDVAFLDPFCGTGGVLIEAALQGMYSVGVDVNYRQVRGSKKNLSVLGLRAVADLVLCDSTKLPFRAEAFNAAAFDPPYGRLAPTHGRDPGEILRGALRNVVESVKPRGRIAFFASDMLLQNVDAPALCDVYEHSSLTRHVIVVRRTNHAAGGPAGT